MAPTASPDPTDATPSAPAHPAPASPAPAPPPASPGVPAERPCQEPSLHPALAIALPTLRPTTDPRDLDRILRIGERLIDRTGHSTDVPGSCDLMCAAALYAAAQRSRAPREWRLAWIARADARADRWRSTP